ncbi:hypothetical protein ACHAQA_003862 [Verticillium albo-atrum]
MTPRHRSPRLLASILLLAAPLALAQFKNDFSLYPSGTQGCLDDAANRSQCAGEDAQAMNSCLCSNGGSFVTNAAVCIGREVPNTLRVVWNTMSTSCTDSKVPIAVSEENFIRMGEAEIGTPSTRTTTSVGAATSTTAVSQTTPTTTASADPTGTSSQLPQQPSGTGADHEEDDQPPQSNMSVAVMAGIGAAGAITACLIGTCLFLVYRRRKAGPRYPLSDDNNNNSRNPTLREWKSTDQLHNQNSASNLRPPPTGLGVSSPISPVTATATTPYPPSAAWTADSPQTAGWGNYHSPTWTGSPVLSQNQQHGGFAELPSDRQAAHELDSLEVSRPPVEMPAPHFYPPSPVSEGPGWADQKPLKQ